MASRLVRGLGVIGIAFAIACGSGRNAATRSYAVLSDARSDGAPGFYFLPPVAPQPAPSPENDPGLSPVVEIAALGGGALLVRFEGDAVKSSGAHYMVHWSTKDAVPVAGTTYRITVLLGGKALGFADAAVAKNGRELRMLASDEVFGLTGQRTVPIKFAIEEQQTDPCEGVTCEPPTQCQVSVACDPALASCVAAAQPAGTPCDDGSFCTSGDACDGSGACAAGTGSPCAASDPAAGADNAQCNPLNRCDPAAAACVYDHLLGTDCTAIVGEQPVPGLCDLGEGGFSVCVPPPPA